MSIIRCAGCEFKFDADKDDINIRDGKDYCHGCENKEGDNPMYDDPKEHGLCFNELM